MSSDFQPLTGTVHRANVQLFASHTDKDHTRFRVNNKNGSIHLSWKVTSWIRQTFYKIVCGRGVKHQSDLASVMRASYSDADAPVAKARIAHLAHSVLRSQNPLFQSYCPEGHEDLERISTSGANRLADTAEFTRPMEAISCRTKTFQTTKAGGVWARRKEAACIGARTQFKRLLRGATCNAVKKFKYFTDPTQAIYAEDKTINPYHDNRSEVQIQHIRHATTLIQTKGINIITDPVFGDLNKVFYPGKVKAACKPHELPPIDVVLLSHDHPDHFSGATEELLKHQPIMIVPKGDADYFIKLGFSRARVIEVEPWEQVTVEKGSKQVTITAVFADHWSFRPGLCNGVGSHQAMTVGHVIDGHTYISGDSAALDNDTIKQINTLFPHLETTLMPGGPNYKRANMHSTHMSITESLRAHMRHTREGNGASYRYGKLWVYHHNAFELGTDRYDEAQLILDAVKLYLRALERDASQESIWIDTLPQFARDDIDHMITLDRFTPKQILDEIENKVIIPRVGEKLRYNPVANRETESQTAEATAQPINKGKEPVPAPSPVHFGNPYDDELDEI